MSFLGAHQSVAGGLHLAFDRLEKVGGESLQIFTRNQRQWQAPALDPEEIDRFKKRWQQAGKIPVASHASYLINLGSSDPVKADKSIQAFEQELKRCCQLGIRLVVIHPGSHGGDGAKAGLERVVKHLDTVIGNAGGETLSLTVLLETTAGQGTGLGSRFEELGWLMQNSAYPSKLGVCLDTCHIFAAGYSLEPGGGYDETMGQLDEEVGRERVHLIHLNDSKKECGSRVDRHEHIGMGRIGLAGFQQLLIDRRFSQLPMMLETPKSKDLHEDVENLERLRSLHLAPPRIQSRGL